MNLSPSSSDEEIAHLLARVSELIQCPEWLIMLDRDGTLVPLADDPGGAVVTSELKALVQSVAAKKNVYLAVISARCISHLWEDFGDGDVILAGNYGMEIKYPGLPKLIEPAALAATPWINEVYSRLEQLIGKRPEFVLEHHELSLCLHLRNVTPSDEKALQTAINSLALEFTQLKFRKRPTSYEVVPQLVWDKSFAMDAICSRIYTTNVPRFYFFAGDAEPDEPGFHWINKRGGVSVKVGSNGAPTDATEYLERPEQLHAFLEKLNAARD